MMLFPLLLPLFSCQNLNEPPDGKLYIGAWLDTADSFPGANDGDRPIKFNQRMGFNSSFFQYAQNIPIDTFPFPYEQIYTMNTDALVYLTVYPRPSPWTITDENIRNLTAMCGQMNRDNRRVIIRFAPEMNGNWNYWGMQPTRFRQLWIRLHQALKRDAPLTAMMWAPSSGNGYPFGGGSSISAEDFALLDTNGDGSFDSRDDAYSPFYPGDQYVDWIGISIYHYGNGPFPWEDNSTPRPGRFEEILNIGNFYQEYSARHNKPMAIAETASTLHVSLVRSRDVRLPIGPGELAIKQPWWQQFMTNRTFLQRYPKIKLISLFEFLKDEETTLRDFRISNNTEILEALKRDFEAIKDMYLFANSTLGAVNRNDPTSPSSPSASPTGNAGIFSSFSTLLLGFVALVHLI